MIPIHEPLPNERQALTHKAIVGGAKIYITTGLYADGRLGEVFIKADKEGAEMMLLNGIAIGISVGLQHGIPLVRFTRKYKYQKLGTGGLTDDPEIRMVKSILDYMARWLDLKYGTDKWNKERIDE